MSFLIRSGVSRGSAVVRRAINNGAQWPVALTNCSYGWWGGDSQTDGRETEETAKSPPEIFRIIARDTGIWEPDGYTINGVSGRSLAETFSVLDAATITGNPLIWLQESGNQNHDGQRTAAEWAATFRAMWRALHVKYPAALKMYETAGSFRRQAVPFRNWDPYNVELRSSIVTLASEGIDIILVESEAYTNALFDILTYDVVCFPDSHINAYHYQGVGNLVIALAGWHALGVDVGALHMGGVNLPPAYKAAAVSVITG